MGIWVKDQFGGRRLICELDPPYHVNNDYLIIGYTISGAARELGAYPAEEQALRVLDLMQYFIQEHTSFMKFLDCGGSHQQFGNCVFVMPPAQESEVPR